MLLLDASISCRIDAFSRCCFGFGGLQSHMPFQKNAHALVGGTANRFGLKTLLELLRSLTHSTLRSRKTHPSPNTHTGVYRVKKANLETWLDVLRGLSLIPRSPLTCPLGLLKRLLKPLKYRKPNGELFRQWFRHQFRQTFRHQGLVLTEGDTPAN